MLLKPSLACFTFVGLLDLALHPPHLQCGGVVDAFLLSFTHSGPQGSSKGCGGVLVRSYWHSNSQAVGSGQKEQADGVEPWNKNRKPTINHGS